MIRSRSIAAGLAVFAGSALLWLLPRGPVAAAAPRRLPVDQVKAADSPMVARHLLLRHHFSRSAVTASAMRVSQIVQRHRHWLAQLVAAEAGDQPYLEKLAVAAVVMNRLQSPRFPHRWWAVLHQANQFETVAAGTWAKAHPSPSDWRAAKQAMAGRDPVPHAFYFYNPALTTVPWMETLTGCQTIDAMRFCTH